MHMITDNSRLDPESEREMLRVMEIEAGRIPDDNLTIDDVDEFFDQLVRPERGE